MPFVLNKTRGLSENWLLLIIGVISISASLILDNRGFPQKWHAAIMWTGVAFGTTILSSHKKLNSWRFWMVWFSLFFLHILLMWFVFSILLFRLRVFGMLFVIPLGFVEALVVIGVTRRNYFGRRK